MSITVYPAEEFIPSVPPPGGNPARTHTTTQLMVKVAGWPNVFRIWFPEQVGPLWTDAERVLQEYAREGDRLVWRQGNAIEAVATVEESTLAMEVRVTNHSGAGMADLGVAHCVQLSTAPDFACDDFSRIFVRTAGMWASLASLRPSSDYPHYFHTDLIEAGCSGAGGGTCRPCSSPWRSTTP